MLAEDLGGGEEQQFISLKAGDGNCTWSKIEEGRITLK